MREVPSSVRVGSTVTVFDRHAKIEIAGIVVEVRRSGPAQRTLDDESIVVQLFPPTSWLRKVSQGEIDEVADRVVMFGWVLEHRLAGHQPFYRKLSPPAAERFTWDLVES
jgi:hypothetical protein